MSRVTVGEAKKFLRIEHSLEDELIESFIAVAVEWCLGYCNHDATETGKESFKHAVKLLVSHFYENRELVSTGNTIPREIPMGVKDLLSMERRFPL